MTTLFINESKRIKVMNRINTTEQGADLKALAEEALSHKPYSVTHNGPAIKGKTNHDYYSQAPYWWPNPEDPKGPYIRRDGLFNPHIFLGHKMALRHLCQDVFILAQAGHYLDQGIYSDHAAKLLEVWFVDVATRMNPNLEFAQAIPGICSGRGIGIIDTMYYVHLLQGVVFLERDPKYSAVVTGVRAWFEEFLEWMTMSEKGIDEKLNGNNHSTWWVLQVATYAVFVGRRDIFDESIEWYKARILPEQMLKDGSFPAEIARTRSFHYAMFNIHPCVLLCELAAHQLVDLWHYSDGEGRGINKAIAFMLPYIKAPSSWPYPNIDPVKNQRSCTSLLAGERLSNSQLSALDHSFPQIVGRAEDYTDIFYPLYLLG